MHGVCELVNKEHTSKSGYALAVMQAKNCNKRSVFRKYTDHAFNHAQFFIYNTTLLLQEKSYENMSLNSGGK